MTSIESELILENENLIYSIISKYQKYYELDDLYQVAVIGFLKAYKKFDSNYMTKFTSFAYKYMLGEVIHYVNGNRNVKLNREILHLNKKINEAKTVLTQKLMKEPTIYELSLFLEIEEGILEEVIMATRDSDSLDRVISEDGKNLLLIDTIADTKSDYDIDIMLLNEQIKSLSPEEQKLLEFRYFQDRTQKEVADYLGIYQVQVSRTETKILKKLKKSMEQTM